MGWNGMEWSGVEWNMCDHGIKKWGELIPVFQYLKGSYKEDRGSLSSCFPPPCQGQRHLPLEQVAPSPVQPGLEHRQTRGNHSFSGQPVPAPQHPHREEILPHA